MRSEKYVYYIGKMLSEKFLTFIHYAVHDITIYHQSRFNKSTILIILGHILLLQKILRKISIVMKVGRNLKITQLMLSLCPYWITPNLVVFLM